MDGPLACMTDGVTSAARSVRLPIRRSHIWAKRVKAGAEVRALSTVTRVLTNQAGTRVTGVEYYDDKQQKQIQEASVVLAGGMVGAESAAIVELRDRQTSKGPRQRERPRRPLS